MHSITKEKYIFFSLFILYILWRLYHLSLYNFQQVDFDQATLWYGCADYAHGFITDLYFYGQNYNSMIESLFAVPLYWCNVPLNIALPLSATFFSLLPYFILWTLCIKKQDYFIASIILTFLFFQSVEADIIASMPRAILTGNGFAMLGVILLQESKSKKITYSIAIICMYIGFFATRTSILLSIIGVLAWLFTSDVKKTYRYVIYGVIVSCLLELSLYIYYQYHKQYIIFPSNLLGISWNTFIQNIHDFSLLWQDFSIIHNSSIILAIFIFLIGFFYITNKKNCLLCSIGLFLSFSILCMNKTRNFFENDIAYSVTRFYFFIPILLCFFITKIPFTQLKKRIYYWIAIIICCVTCCSIKIYSLQQNKLNAFACETLPYSIITKLDQDICSLLKETNCNLCLFENPARTISYTMGALHYNKIWTYNTEGDRRNTMTYGKASQKQEKFAYIVLLPKNIQSNMYAWKPNTTISLYKTISYDELNMDLQFFIINEKNKSPIEWIRRYVFNGNAIYNFK